VNLGTANTAIVLDSTADLPDAADRFPNWRVVPLYVRFGDESLRDGVDITADQFYERLREGGVFPTTSQPTPGDFVAVYEQLPQYDRVYSLHIAGTLSGTVESARAAAEQFGDRIRVIDTESASAAIAMLALAIQRRLERGTTEEEIEALADRHRTKARLIFTLDTLDYLARGGRIGRATAFAGALLAVKPILTVRDDEVVPLKRVRGTRSAFAEFRTMLESGSRDEPSLRIGLAHAAAPDRLEQLESIVRAARPHAQVELATPIGPVLATHAGPGAVGLFWFDDPVL
jgi:DegV family protein with EDD domain